MDKQTFMDLTGENPEDMFGGDWQNEVNDILDVKIKRSKLSDDYVTHQTLFRILTVLHGLQGPVSYIYKLDNPTIGKPKKENATQANQNSQRGTGNKF